MDKEVINKTSLTNTLVTGLILGMIVPVFGWMLDFIINDLSFSLSTFLTRHLENPVHLLLYLFPIILVIVLYRQYKMRINEHQAFLDELNVRKTRMDRTAKFASRIGEGDYQAEFNLDSDDDVLGKSLILMRDNLLSNKENEEAQNWIAEGKDIIQNILRLHNKVEDLAYDVIVNLIKYIDVIQGAFYVYENKEEKLVNQATYAYNRRKFINQEFKLGHGLIGQCAYEMDIVYRTEIPDDYVTITSGILGDKKPCSILIVPLISDEKLQGVLEFASVNPEFSELNIRFLRELGEIIARTVFNLKVNQRTENLLQESQKMTEELQQNEEQLRQNAEEMRATQEELEKSNIQLEKQIQQVENAQKRLHSLLENASEVITIYSKDLKMTYCSPSVRKILGFEIDEMMGGKDLDRLTRKGEASMQELFKKLVENPKEVITIQYTYMKKTGDKIFLETTGRNFINDPAIEGIILNSQDITERKRAEKEERLKGKMQSLSENSLDMIVRLSTAGQFFYANPVVEEYLGIKPKDVMNKTIKNLSFTEILQEYFREEIKKLKEKPEKTNTELVLTEEDQEAEIEERIMSVDAIPEFNENELETILFVGHDITEMKRIEREIKDKNKKIEESINYAERIQSSILPDNSIIREELPKSFIFYRPRDVVSGDFPWFFKKNDDIYIAAVDCTGHGVPGALLSFIGYFLLNNIVDHDDTNFTAASICDKLHWGVRTTLKQDRADANARDGMDIAFCKINSDRTELHYAGAHRPLYLIRDGELQEFKGDRKAIGGIPHKKKLEKDFTNYIIRIQPGDKIFFFSDGLPDQLGGPEKKKYTARRIREHIAENKDYNMEQYHELFEKDFYKWKGETKQIDDVLLIGIEF